MSTVYNTFNAEVATEFKELGSKFLTIGFPCDSIESFENHLAEIKKEHYDATHHCYGWRIDPFDITEFAQDDGEPSGTAGLPILNQLRSANLCNTGIVVIRYYGGTKLGKSGLISAYGSSAEECIEQAKLVRIVPGKSLRVKAPYEHVKQVEYLTGMHDAVHADTTYAAEVTFEIHVPNDSFTALFDAISRLEYLGVKCDEGNTVIITL
ncbi:MAG: YigZ family protein [Balneolia bacterium]|nr:YigZ family protein [Balneolia bacterium]